MKKICLVIHSLGIGGMERVMYLLAKNFSKREDLEIHLILIGKKREIIYPIPNTIMIHKPGFKFSNSRRTLNILRTIYFLRSKIKAIDPYAILSFGEYWNNLVLLSLYGLSNPVFISDRSQPDKDLGPVQNLLRNKLYPKAAGYIAQTEEAQRICLAKGWNGNVRRIGNPIRQIHTNGEHQRENTILTVGRLIKTKHFDRLIRMFKELDQSDWKLVIVGGDAKRLELSKDLEALINSLEVQNSVYLEGEQTDIDRYYKKSKIFAFTSSSEGFPNVVGEAMSSGLPVVSYDCVAGPSDLIEDGKNGFLIPLFNNELFMDKLSSLMVDEDLRKRMSDNAKISIEKYKPEIIADKYYDFITSSVKTAS